MSDPIRVQSPFACATARLKLARAVQAVKPMSRTAKAGALVRASYLATATGAEKHILSVALHQGVESLVTHPGRVTVDYLTALAKSVASRAKGNPLPPSAFREVGSAFNSHAGRLVWDAFTKGNREAWSAIKAGIDPEVVGDAFNTERATFDNPLLQTAVDRLNTFVTARNKPFYEMALQGSGYVYAKALAIREGLTGAAQTARINEMLARPSDQMAAHMLESAAKQTFSNVGPATKFIEGGRRGLQAVRDQALTRTARERAQIQATTEGLSGGHHAERVNRLLALPRGEFERTVQVPRELTGVAATKQKAKSAGAGLGLLGLDVTVPFARIGFNLAARGLDYSPLGAAKALVWSMSAKDPAILREGLIKAGAGTMTGLATGYYLASTKRMTGGGDKQHPYRLKIGDTWHDYTVFMPFGIMPALGADLYELQTKHPEQFAGNVGEAMKRQGAMITEHSILASMQHVTDLFDKTQSFTKKAQQLLPVPPLLRQVWKGATGAPEGIAGAVLDPTRPQPDRLPPRQRARP